MAETEDRTEAATPRRLEQAREEGNVPLSREAASLAGLAAVMLAGMLAGPGAAGTLALRLRPFLEPARWNLSDGGAAAVGAAARAALGFAWPFLAASLLAGSAAVLLQTGFLLRPAALLPSFGKLNPLQGLSRLFGTQGLGAAGRAALKLLVLAALLWKVGLGLWPTLPGAVAWGPALLADRMLRAVLHLGLALLAVCGALAAADLFWVRFRHARALRMSRQELREEMRESEGSPEIRQRLRALRRSRARRRMMAAVPKATVVVTNPTHYAVALAYERGRGGAPRVVAKGVDAAAARIRAVAGESGVPLVANPPLARALYRVELEAEIPPEHFQAVAEIIAWVWRQPRPQPRNWQAGR